MAILSDMGSATGKGEIISARRVLAKRLKVRKIVCVVIKWCDILHGATKETFKALKSEKQSFICDFVEITVLIKVYDGLALILSCSCSL